MLEMPTNNVNNDVIDIDLSVTSKKKFRIDKDDSRIIELNTSDMNIIGRLSDAYPKILNVQSKMEQLTDGTDTEMPDVEDADDSIISGLIKDCKTIGDRFKELDGEIRDLVDYIFDSKISNIVAPDGSMCDIFEGTLRYEHIISVLMGLYETNLQSEYAKIEAKMKSHTDKYTKR